MADGGARQGPLSGISVVEFTGIGPAPFAAMLLADLGARVLRIDRPGGYPPPDPGLDFNEMGRHAIFNRGRHAVRLDLKAPASRDLVLRLVGAADALIEGYRPGTMERLGLGPQPCLAANPRLVYARMTGWGQTGPLALTAGHDLNYVGLSGALSLFGQDGTVPRAIPPLVGDMGGGGLMMAFGLLAGILEARQSGLGQVLDAAIVDGAAALCALPKALRLAGAWAGPAGTGTLDGGRHYYRQYRCADGRFVAVGAIEPAFRTALLDGLGLLDDPRFLSGREDDEAHCTRRLEEIFASRDRDHWADLFAATDACVTPVLGLEEADGHPQAAARGAIVTIDDVAQHAPVPRFSRTPGAVAVSPAQGTRNTPGALRDWGLSEDEIEALIADGIVEAG